MAVPTSPVNLDGNRFQEEKDRADNSRLPEPAPEEGGQSGVEKKVRLKCLDGGITEVKKMVARESITIKKKMLEASSADEVIELDMGSSAVLSDIMDYCRKHVEARRENNEDKLKSLDLNFLERLISSYDLEILDREAKYLGIMSLVKFIDQKVDPQSAAEPEEEEMPELDDTFDFSEDQHQHDEYGETRRLLGDQPPSVQDIEMAVLTSPDQFQGANEGLRHRLVPGGSDIQKSNMEGLRHRSVHAGSHQHDKYGETKRLLDDQPSIDEDVEMGSMGSFESVQRSSVDGDGFQGADEGLQPVLTGSGVNKRLQSVPGGSDGGDKPTRPSWLDQTSSTFSSCVKFLLKHLEKICVIINLVLELLSAVCDQLASVEKPQYAIVSMSLSFVAVVLCIVELLYKCQNYKVTWTGTSEQNHGKPFGNLVDNIGLICAIGQCIFATINFYFTRRHIDSPIKICIWPIVFASCLLFSKFSEKPDEGRNQLNDEEKRRRDLVAIGKRMATVEHKILILSGKGGVGKSTFSAQLSFALAMHFRVGLLDIDICGLSIPKMLGLEGQEIRNRGWSPVCVESNLRVMSFGFMLPNPDVDWGDIDFLVVDAPPRTSDEYISIVQFLEVTGIDGAIIVTTPQQVSLIDVRKEVNFCKKVRVPVLGVVENMSGLCQPLTDFRFIKGAGTSAQIDVTEKVIEYMREKEPDILDVIAVSEVFDSSGGGVDKMCVEMEVPFLGKVPLDPQFCKAAEEGRSCFADGKCGVSAPALKSIIDKLLVGFADGKCGVSAPALKSIIDKLLVGNNWNQEITMNE